MLKLSSLFALIFTLTGCAESVTFTEAAMKDPVGFWYGLWHGLIFSFAYGISVFDESVTVYAIYNNGYGYNFGFFTGLWAPILVFFKLRR